MSCEGKKRAGENYWVREEIQSGYQRWVGVVGQPHRWLWSCGKTHKRVRRGKRGRLGSQSGKHTRVMRWTQATVEPTNSIIGPERGRGIPVAHGCELNVVARSVASADRPMVSPLRPRKEKRNDRRGNQVEARRQKAWDSCCRATLPPPARPPPPHTPKRRGGGEGVGPSTYPTINLSITPAT